MFIQLLLIRSGCHLATRHFGSISGISQSTAGQILLPGPENLYFTLCVPYKVFLHILGMSDGNYTISNEGGMF